MSNGRDARLIKRVRNETLVALQLVYPAALRADVLARSLITLFPTLDFEQLKRDLHYLLDKGYVERVLTDADDNGLTPWRQRWFRLTATGVEVADHLLPDPALDES